MQNKPKVIWLQEPPHEPPQEGPQLAKTVKIEAADGKVHHHTMIFGTTGQGKSLLREQYEKRGYEIIDVFVEPDIPPRKPKAPLPPVKVDEYLTLPGELFRDASGTIHDILGCFMTQEGVARFLSASRIGAQILWFNEVETQIRDDMYHALEEFLTGQDSWIDRHADYDTRVALLRAAARARGYLQESDSKA